jgi:hypothetical protein
MLVVHFPSPSAAQLLPQRPGPGLVVADWLRMALGRSLRIRHAPYASAGLFPISGRWALTAAVSLRPVTRDSPAEMGGRVASPTLIGRVEELDLLEAARRRAADAEPAVVLVGGEAGVGKTRLVAELITRCAADGIRVLAGGCVPVGDGGLPYAPIVEALWALLADVGVGAVRELAGPSWPELAGLLPALGEPDRTVLPDQGPTRPACSSCCSGCADRPGAVHHPQDRQRPRLKDPGQAGGRRPRRGSRGRPPARPRQAMTCLGLRCCSSRTRFGDITSGRATQAFRVLTPLAAQAASNVSPRGNAFYDRCATDHGRSREPEDPTNVLVRPALWDSGRAAEPPVFLLTSGASWAAESKTNDSVSADQRPYGGPGRTEPPASSLSAIEG